MKFTKIFTADLDASRQELSNGDLKIVLHTSFRFSGNWLWCVYTGGAIQLYVIYNMKH